VLIDTDEELVKPIVAAVAVPDKTYAETPASDWLVPAICSEEPT
jgi:hypothetical protein